MAPSMGYYAPGAGNLTKGARAPLPPNRRRRSRGRSLFWAFRRSAAPPSVPNPRPRPVCAPVPASPPGFRRARALGAARRPCRAILRTAPVAGTRTGPSARHERTRKPLPRPDRALARAAKAALSGMNRGRNVVFSAGHEVRGFSCAAKRRSCPRRGRVRRTGPRGLRRAKAAKRTSPPMRAARPHAAKPPSRRPGFRACARSAPPEPSRNQHSTEQRINIRPNKELTFDRTKN